MYQINIREDQISVEIIKQNTQKVLNKEVNKLQEALSKGITCQIISSSDYDNDLLGCITAEVESSSIIGAIFDAENLTKFIFF